MACVKARLHTHITPAIYFCNELCFSSVFLGLRNYSEIYWNLQNANVNRLWQLGFRDKLQIVKKEKVGEVNTMQMLTDWVSIVKQLISHKTFRLFFTTRRSRRGKCNKTELVFLSLQSVLLIFFLWGSSCDFAKKIVRIDSPLSIGSESCFFIRFHTGKNVEDELCITHTT